MRIIARALLTILGFVVLIEALSTALMILAFRTQNPTALHLVKQYNKHVWNPVMLSLSGESAHSGALHHVGRRSGTRRATPVTAHRANGDVVIPLPYGTEVDWLRNLLAAGRGELDLEGRTVVVTEPAIVDIADVVDLLPGWMNRMVRLHETRQAVRMRVSESATASA